MGVVRFDIFMGDDRLEEMKHDDPGWEEPRTMTANQEKEWSEERIVNHLREVFTEMVRLRTNLVRDREGAVWAFGKWYGDRPHFRKNMDHWSEEVLIEDWQFSAFLPLVPFKHPLSDPPNGDYSVQVNSFKIRH